MPVYFTDNQAGLRYEPVRIRSDRGYEEYVEVYHVLPGTRQVVPSGQLCRVRPASGPTVRRLGTMAYSALLPQMQYPCTAMQCAASSALFLIQAVFYVYVFLFTWTLTIRFLEWGQ